MRRVGHLQDAMSYEWDARVAVRVAVRAWIDMGWGAVIRSKANGDIAEADRRSDFAFDDIVCQPHGPVGMQNEEFTVSLLDLTLLVPLGRESSRGWRLKVSRRKLTLEAQPATELCYVNQEAVGLRLLGWFQAIY
jgi:hypothetical protein